MQTWFRIVLEPRWLLVVVLCIGCGGSQARPAAVEQIVFDTASVVEAAPEGEGAQGPRIGSQVLPPLPVDLQSASEAFRQGWQLASEFLNQPSLQPPKEDHEAFEAWLHEGFQQWLAQTGTALERARKPLHAAAAGPVGETVVAAALEGLMFARLSEIVAAVPPPPKLRESDELVAIYRQGVDEARSPWLQNAGSAFRFCASRAARLKATPYGDWKRFCAERALQLAQLSRQIEERARKAERERQEARAKLIGPRPPGPAHCWQPKTGTGPELPGPRPPTATNPQAASIRFALVIDDSGGRGRIPLLAEEREKLRTAAQKHLGERFGELVASETWLSPRQIAKWETTWRTARAAPGGPKCGRASDRYRVLRATYPNLFLAKLFHRCAEHCGQCNLVVRFDTPSATGLGGTLTAALAGPLEELDTWMAALKGLAPPDSGYAPLGPPPTEASNAPLVVHAAETYGTWPETADAKAVVQAGGDELLRCRAGRPHAPQTYEAVLQIDARGRVAQLWRPAVESRVEPQYRCMDKALRRVSFSPAQDDSRRLSLVLVFDARQSSLRDQAYGHADPQTGVRVSLSSGDSAAFDPAHLHSRALQGQLASCLATNTDEAQEGCVALDLAIAVSKTGRVQSVKFTSANVPATDATASATEATAPATGTEKAPTDVSPTASATAAADDTPISPKLQKCVRDAVKTVAFACSATGEPAELTARVCMQRTRHEQPQATPQATAE